MTSPSSPLDEVAAEIQKRLPALGHTDRVSLGWSQTVEDCKILLRLLAEKEAELATVMAERDESLDDYGRVCTIVTDLRAEIEADESELSACLPLIYVDPGQAAGRTTWKARAESAEAELSRVKGERDELKAKISRNREAEFDAAEFD